MLNKCRDCREKGHELDLWGRCEPCAEELTAEVEAAEAAAGWDPNP